MPNVLTAEQVDRYHGQGWVSPLDVLTPEQASEARDQLEAFEATQGHPITAPERIRPHLLFRWVDDLMRNETILDAVEQLIGPDILCWSSVFWVKEANSASYVGWHQDLQYWGLDNAELVSVWVALADASEAAGCMSVIDGSHLELLSHNETYNEDNLLSRGQELAIDLTDRETSAMPLRAGQASLHNVRLAHGSGPNTTDDRRIGLSLQYVPPHTSQTLGDWDTAALVRGNDPFGNFEHSPRPARDFDPECVAFHARATDSLRELLYKGAQKQSDPTL